MAKVDFKTVGAGRLIELANILERADELHRQHNEPTYYQRYWTHLCGTPACALGHWAHAQDLRLQQTEVRVINVK